MKKIDVIRAWKDEAYRAGLSEAERAQLPASPVGVVEIHDEYLKGASGGMPNTFSCCTTLCSDSCCTHNCP